MQGSGSGSGTGPFEVSECAEDCGTMTLTDSPVFAVGMMLAGLAVCMIWYGFRLKKAQMPVSAAVLAAAFGSLLALVCAKAGYLLHDLGATLFEGYFDEVTELTPDLLSFAAGAAGFTAGTAMAAKLCGIRPMKALDLFDKRGVGCAVFTASSKQYEVRAHVQLDADPHQRIYRCADKTSFEVR